MNTTIDFKRLSGKNEPGIDAHRPPAKGCPRAARDCLFGNASVVPLLSLRRLPARLGRLCNERTDQPIHPLRIPLFFCVLHFAFMRGLQSLGEQETALMGRIIGGLFPKPGSIRPERSIVKPWLQAVSSTNPPHWGESTPPRMAAWRFPSGGDDAGLRRRHHPQHDGEFAANPAQDALPRNRPDRFSGRVSKHDAYVPGHVRILPGAASVQRGMSCCPTTWRTGSAIWHRASSAPPETARSSSTWRIPSSRIFLRYADDESRPAWC